jgi:hypothetical protein
MYYDNEDLGHYDDSEEFDDSLYFNDTVDNDIQKPIKQYHSRFLPDDIINDILIRSDMDTFIKICSSSKNMRQLGTNQLWQYKFNQHHIPISNNHQKNFNDWVVLYHQHLHQSADYEKADRYLDFIRNIKEDFFYNPLIYSTFFTINLQKSLSNAQLIKFLQDVTHHHDIVIDNRVDYYSIKIYYTKTIIHNNLGIHNNVGIYNNFINPKQFRQFLYLLFKNHYIDEKWVYLY